MMLMLASTHHHTSAGGTASLCASPTKQLTEGDLHIFPKHTNRTLLVVDALLAADDMRRERRWLGKGRVQQWLGMMVERRQHKSRTTCEAEQRSI